MRLDALPRTTGFKLALLFFSAFGAASLIFVAVVYTTTTVFLTGHPDERMLYQAMKFDVATAEEIDAKMDGHTAADPTGRRPFGLFTADGRWLAGNLTQFPRPRPRLGTFFETDVRTAQERTRYRSIMHRLPDGRLIVVSRNIEELQRFRDQLFRATLLGAGLMLALGLAGAVAVGLISVRRLDRMTAVIARITSGDLTGRLPTRTSTSDIDRLARVVNGMLDQIERLMGEVKGVCDSIAHDLRTPLTRLLAGLERANRRNLTDAERHAAIDQAVADTRSMLRTFAALLRISEIEDGARRASFDSVDLRAVARDAVDLHEPVAEAKGVRLALATPAAADGAVAIHGDTDLLFEALGNLIDNAVKFTPPGGTVTVAVGAGPRVTVADTGPGIAPHDRDRVTLRFHRADRARDTPGNGLGLALVVAITRLHGLTLRFESAAPGCRVVLQKEAVAGPP